jgi:hypothetical protein
MENKDIENTPLQYVSTDKLEALFSNVLKEMRRRDSKSMAGDVITKSQSLRLLRVTDKLP